MTPENLDRLKMLDIALCAQIQANEALHDLITTVLEYEKAPPVRMKPPRRVRLRKA